ncbi:MAG: hypothetical protein WA843_03870 [Candidatus Saccharimonadales bacterium]
MEKLIVRLQRLFPELTFTPGKQFYWSPESSEIFYKSGADGAQAIWSLLHETGHALLKHATYKADFELLTMEVAAWERARVLAQEIGASIDEDHIQDCLDTYRDWLYKRSICPTCSTKSLQQSDFVHYRCFNCNTRWQVSASRFHRTYRQNKELAQKADQLVI